MIDGSFISKGTCKGWMGHSRSAPIVSNTFGGHLSSVILYTYQSEFHVAIVAPP